MKRCTKWLMAGLVIATLCGQSFGFEITKVIEVGRGGGTSVATPKWSPDGTKLAYFRGSFVCISDTLGHSRDIVTLDMPPHEYEWLSNYELVIGLWRVGENGIRSFRLIRLDINTSEITILEEFERSKKRDPYGDPRSFDGPFLSLEGNVYYSTNTIKRPLSGSQGIKFVESGYQKAPAKPSENHFVEWGADGLMITSCDKKETARIAPKPYSDIIFPPAVKADMSCYIHGGTMYRFTDSTYIVLDTLIKQKPADTYGCFFMYSSINPRFNEVAFQLICEGFIPGKETYDDGTEIEYPFAGVFNYDNGKLTILDSLISVEECSYVSYSPGGLMLAVVGVDRIYILCRDGI